MPITRFSTDIDTASLHFRFLLSDHTPPFERPPPAQRRFQVFRRDAFATRRVPLSSFELFRLAIAFALLPRHYFRLSFIYINYIFYYCRWLSQKAKAAEGYIADGQINSAG